jgi:hypothetical protein
MICYKHSIHADQLFYVSTVEISGCDGREIEGDSLWDKAPCSLVEVGRRFRSLMMEVVHTS